MDRFHFILINSEQFSVKNFSECNLSSDVTKKRYIDIVGSEMSVIFREVKASAQLSIISDSYVDWLISSSYRGRKKKMKESIFLRVC